MRQNKELLDFEIDPVSGDVHVVDASAEGEALLSSMGMPEQSMDAALVGLVRRRVLVGNRPDREKILEAFGAKSNFDLVLMGHGASLSDLFWYRSPGSTERWEDINFFDNEWDPRFGASVLSGDYSGLATCSPDIPDATTPGHAVKAWERTSDGVFQVKKPSTPDGADLAGSKLAADMCAALFDEGCYIPLDIVERYGNLCASSPLMLSGDEELADGCWLHTMAGIQDTYSPDRSASEVMEQCNSHIDAYTTIGVADASAHVARMACCSCLALLADFHPGNFGAIRNIVTDTWRAAPIFDYDGSFGFPGYSGLTEHLCASPGLAELLCAHRFSFLDPSWDWSWYDPQVLVGFEKRILEAYVPYQSCPPHFGEVVAHLFVIQRKYVNGVVAVQL